ncbi:MAG: ribonuclease D, partial [Chloroflexota bacterium]|nr:ribonuclease D [Chloroflexota bacterium]
MYKSNVQRKILIVVHEPAEIISTSERLKSLSAEAAIQPWIGIDIEGNGFFRYPERVCLIQISIGQTPYLIDPLDVEDMSPLGEVLSDASVTKILHSGDYDIRSLHRDYGFQFENVFDTSIAAGFLGSKRLGLDAILKEYLDVEV